MKRLFLLFACMTALAVILSVPSASAQGKLEGVWKASEITLAGPNASTAINVAPMFTIITKKYVSQIGLQGPQPDLPQNGTDAQKLATWTPFYSSLGTYEVKGTTATIHPILQKNGAKPGAFNTVDFKIEGNTLTITSKANQNGPVTNPMTFKFVRVE